MSVNYASIDSANGLSPVRYQAVIQANAVSLFIGPLGTNFSETQENGFKNIICEMAVIFLGLNILILNTL